MDLGGMGLVVYWGLIYIDGGGVEGFRGQKNLESPDITIWCGLMRLKTYL